MYTRGHHLKSCRRGFTWSCAPVHKFKVLPGVTPPQSIAIGRRTLGLGPMIVIGGCFYLAVLRCYRVYLTTIHHFYDNLTFTLRSSVVAHCTCVVTSLLSVRNKMTEKTTTTPYCCLTWMLTTSSTCHLPRISRNIIKHSRNIGNYDGTTTTRPWQLWRQRSIYKYIRRVVNKLGATNTNT